ncbi:MAG: RNA 2',3'-cyclic phosphodiesterase [Aquabacterium sp.]|uniref:RNA 2',3'-cyclic phosphodiesterase n=1 Tax=Aquabacterium sp. TaxID=1872578 RepID=UPI002A35D1B2|nr:RNA 2',3'-cyclic phosphodiesterase [Aquabacterium sp.]MDX9844226.1 RNA 2',3'-cyclic phosphodiesterase [Aquabacterium sp.]
MTPDPTLRLFLALWPDDDTRAVLLAWQQAQSWPAGARLTRANDLHLTLHFLGQVPKALLPALKQALPAAGSPVILTLDHLDVWPNGVAVLRPEATPPTLLDLHAHLGDALKQLGLPLESRPYQPHITLARRARGLVPKAALPLRWTAQRYALVLSDHGYHPLQHYG